MASPLWAYPGIREGRIAPEFSTSGTGSIYGYYYPYPTYYYYGYTSGHVFCLGRDLIPFPKHRLTVGATASVEQSFVVTTLHKILYFVWHMRVPTDLPAAHTVISNGPVSFVVGATAPGNRGLLDQSDGMQGAILDSPDATTQFLAADYEQWCTITGTGGGLNDGTFRITTAMQPVGGGYYDRAILENPGIVQTLNDPNVAIRVHGLYWKARAYLQVTGSGAWQERVVLQEQVGHNYVRGTMALHVSQFTGPMDVKFELKLEQEL